MAAPAGERVLAIDTTGERCAVALFAVGADEVLASATPHLGRGHAERLMDIVAQVLGEAGQSYGDLSRIAVTVGPGSFTGIRVGVSAARGLALALGVPAVGVDTLAALAEPHRGAGFPVLAVQDARRGEIYAALYDRAGHPLASPSAVPEDGVAALLAPFVLEGAVGIVGSAARQAAAQIHGFSEPRILSTDGTPSIAAVARIGAGLDPGTEARPLYLRAADAKPPAALRLVQPNALAS